MDVQGAWQQHKRSSTVVIGGFSDRIKLSRWLRTPACSALASGSADERKRPSLPALGTLTLMAAALSAGATSFTVTISELTANTTPFPIVLGNSPARRSAS